MSDSHFLSLVTELVHQDRTACQERNPGPLHISAKKGEPGFWCGGVATSKVYTTTKHKRKHLPQRNDTEDNRGAVQSRAVTVRSRAVAVRTRAVTVQSPCSQECREYSEKDTPDGGAVCGG